MDAQIDGLCEQLAFRVVSTKQVRLSDFQRTCLAGQLGIDTECFIGGVSESDLSLRDVRLRTDRKQVESASRDRHVQATDRFPERTRSHSIRHRPHTGLEGDRIGRR
ncbi:hypothetical protein ABZ726_17910 [Streptomyces hundungensis]|uniref:hypothetical protein n=1 Tax=Streptomyces hundungensis TaxID=1077946 RepID=UPI0033FD9E01